MTLRQVPFGAWVVRVLTWDAFLPAAVAYVPMGLEVVIPGRRGLVELTAVVLPIAALFVRYRVGRRLIDGNRCSPRIRRLQRLVFGFGLLPLVLIECVLILSALMPAGAVLGDPGDRLVWAILGSVYLMAMIAAMYPGRVAGQLLSIETAKNTRSPDWA